MTKMNWDRARNASKLQRPYDLPTGGRSQKLRKEIWGFLAKFDGTCYNCKMRFPARTFVRYNRQHGLIHGRGCPTKTSRTN